MRDNGPATTMTDTDPSDRDDRDDTQTNSNSPEESDGDGESELSRDDIRHNILLRLFNGEIIQVNDYPDDKEWTVRRVLRKLEDQDWVERSPPQSPRWRPGTLARAMFGPNPESGLEPPEASEVEEAGEIIESESHYTPDSGFTHFGEGGVRGDSEDGDTDED